MRNLASTLVILGLVMAGCSADPVSKTQAGKGACETEDGVVNTYNLIGKWKKVSSTAEPPTSEADREFNYEILVFEPGAAACMGVVVNKALTSSAFKAVYVHDVPSQTFNITYTAHVDRSLENTSEDVRYSFSGSCGKTILNLSYPKDGIVEQYELFSTKVEQGDCN